MRCRDAIWVLILGGGLVAGCSKNDGADPKAEGQGVAAAESESQGAAAGLPELPNPPEDLNSPEGIVYQFLDAIRRGDDEIAAGMLTKTARARIANLGVRVQPKGSDTARFGLGQVEQLSEEGARVGSTWTDLAADGSPVTEEMVWLLHKEPEGWRVTGMAAVPLEGGTPLLLDFENPQEMLQRIEEVRNEARRRAEAEFAQGESSATAAAEQATGTSAEGPQPDALQVPEAMDPAQQQGMPTAQAENSLEGVRR
jgi:hypothetical protein